MKKQIARPIGALVVAVAGALGLAGCAGLATATPEAAVKQRASAYWKARADSQLEKAYAMSTPSYRAVRSQAQFASQYGAGASVKAAEVAKVSCEAVKCVASVKISVAPALVGMNLGTISTYVDEVWLLEDGQWWRHQDL